jgi:hypothetical protein
MLAACAGCFAFPPPGELECFIACAKATGLTILAAKLTCLGAYFVSCYYNCKPCP